jgi:hypothetical protein
MYFGRPILHQRLQALFPRYCLLNLSAILLNFFELDDGLIEVIGLTTYQLPLLQAGGKYQKIVLLSSDLYSVFIFFILHVRTCKLTPNSKFAPSVILTI